MKFRLVVWGVVVCGIVVILWLTNYWHLFHESETTRGTFGDMFGAVNALFSGLAFAGVVVAILLQGHQIEEARRQSRDAAEAQQKFFVEEARTNTREATRAIFDQWWGEDLWKLRNYFYREFLHEHYQKVTGCSLKQVRRRIAADEGRLLQLTGFFDKVGWLGAAGLIDVDYILGPMQHVVRRVWFATEPLIRKTRGPSDGWFDPAFHLGFEWLYLRTTQPKRTHAELLKVRFSDPDLFNDDQSRVLDRMITDDEKRFRESLGSQHSGGKEDT